MSSDGEVTSLESSLLWNLGSGFGSILCFVLAARTNVSLIDIGRFLALIWIAGCMYLSLRDAGIKGLISVMFWLMISLPGCWMVMSFLSREYALLALIMCLASFAFTGVLKSMSGPFFWLKKRLRNRR